MWSNVALPIFVVIISSFGIIQYGGGTTPVTPAPAPAPAPTAPAPGSPAPATNPTNPASAAAGYLSDTASTFSEALRNAFQRYKQFKRNAATAGLEMFTSLLNNAVNSTTQFGTNFFNNRPGSTAPAPGQQPAPTPAETTPAPAPAPAPA